MKPKSAFDTRVKRKTLIWGFVWVLVYLSSLLILRKTPLEGRLLRSIIALLPVIPFIAYILTAITRIRNMDEFQRKLHLEALVIAFPLSILLVMTLGLLDLSIDLPEADLGYRSLWMYFFFFYFVGLAISRRRYR